MAAARRVAVIGAGLAGAGVARGLVRDGFEVAVFESDSAPAQQTSGNPAALFHGIVHRDDGPHARWLRAAALRSQQVLAPLIDGGAVPGRLGLLRGEKQAARGDMQALLDQMGCPADWVEAVEIDGRCWWHYPGGGWAAPAAVARAWLADPGIRMAVGTRVARLLPTKTGWQLRGGGDRLLGEADVVVLANAGEACALLGESGWPLWRERGQISIVDHPMAPAIGLPLADAGYVLQLPDGRLLCGATAQPDDDDPTLREADHQRNLETLARLTGWKPSPEAAIGGRVGWRLQSGDKLPLLGPAPVQEGTVERQTRLVERRPGLYVAIGYGSRGLTHAALAGELLAAWIGGAPLPLPARLVDALDVARFAARLNRRPAS